MQEIRYPDVRIMVIKLEGMKSHGTYPPRIEVAGIMEISKKISIGVAKEVFGLLD